mgnify:CR=1 FL=1
MFCNSIRYGAGKVADKDKINEAIEKILQILQQTNFPVAITKEILRETEREIDICAKL